MSPIATLHNSGLKTERRPSSGPARNPDASSGRYGYACSLAEVELLLIGLAYDAYLASLLNHSGLPADAPVKNHTYEFESASVGGSGDGSRWKASSSFYT